MGDAELKPGRTLMGPHFSEPMRIITVTPTGAGRWTLGLVGSHTERYRSVTLSEADLDLLTVLEGDHSFDGDAQFLCLGLRAYSLDIAWEFDPYFGLSIFRVDPPLQQLSAVYDHLLKAARVRAEFDLYGASRPAGPMPAPEPKVDASLLSI